MDTSVSSSSLSKDSLSLLERRLAHFRSAESVLCVSRRLFQKCPAAASQLEGELREAELRGAATNRSQRLWTARRLLVRRVAEVMRPSPNEDAEAAMPRKLENYLSFLDLAGVVASCSEQQDNDDLHPSRQQVSSHTWRAFLLRDFDPRGELKDLPLHRLRRRLKQFLPADEMLSSVQLDLDEVRSSSSAIKPNHRVFFRVASVPRTKSGANDERNLLKKPASFIAFYPGEPYFYCDRKDPEQFLKEALCSCLNSSACVSLPLSGPHLESLRQMRKRRDQAKTGAAAEEEQGAEHEVAVSRVGADYAEEDLFEDFVVEHSGPEEEEEEQGEEDKGDNRGWKRPILDRLSVERPAKFRDLHVLEDFHGSRLPVSVDSLDVKVTFRSADVLASLEAMAEAGMLMADTNGCQPGDKSSSSAPAWLRDFAVRGRNAIRLKEARNNADENQDDNASVAASELTVLLR